MDSNEQLIKPSKVSKILDVSRAYPYKLAKEGLLPFVRIGPNRSMRFKLSDVEKFIDKHYSELDQKKKAAGV